MPLTDSMIRRLPAVTKDTWYSDGNNLYLRQSAGGTLTWIFRSKSGGKTQKLKLGNYPEVGLTAARALASQQHLAPKFEPTSVEALCDDYYAVMAPRYRDARMMKVYLNRLKSAFPNRQIGALTRKDLVDTLQAYAKTSPVAANHARATWSQLLSYAYERGYVGANVLAGTTNRIAGGKETPRDRVLTKDEIVEIMTGELEVHKLLRCLLRTGCRISELQGAQGPQIAQRLGVGIKLLIPQNKSAREHWVYLSPAAIKDINQKKGTIDYGPFLFKPVTYHAVQQFLLRQNKGYRAHDLRRTFATLLGDLGCPVVVIEKLLNHSLGGVLAIYNRSEYEAERVEWTQKLSDHLDQLVLETSTPDLKLKPKHPLLGTFGKIDRTKLG